MECASEGQSRPDRECFSSIPVGGAIQVLTVEYMQKTRFEVDLKFISRLKTSLSQLKCVYDFARFGSPYERGSNFDLDNESRFFNT